MQITCTYEIGKGSLNSLIFFIPVQWDIMPCHLMPQFEKVAVRDEKPGRKKAKYIDKEQSTHNTIHYAFPRSKCLNSPRSLATVLYCKSPCLLLGVGGDEGRHISREVSCF